MVLVLSLLPIVTITSLAEQMYFKNVLLCGIKVSAIEISISFILEPKHFLNLMMVKKKMMVMMMIKSSFITL